MNRLAALKAKFATPGDEIEAGRIAEISAIPDDGDSVHRLVMDLHKVLNRLSAACAEETIAGAHAHGVLPADRPIIEAFMGGLARTQALKFDHPGLDTTVMRVRRRASSSRTISARPTPTCSWSRSMASPSRSPTPTFIAPGLNSSSPCSIAFRCNGPVSTGKAPRASGDDDSFYLVTGRYQARQRRRAAMHSLMRSAPRSSF